MEIGVLAANRSQTDPETMKLSLPDLSLEDEDMQDMRSAMEALDEVDSGVAYSSEKLVNLDNLLMHVLACDSDFESLVNEDDNFSEDFIGKALTLDLLHAMLNTEVKEMETFTNDLQALTIGARDKILSSRKSIELFDVVGDKLHECEELLRQSHERIIEMKMHLTKLQMTSLILSQNKWRYNAKLGWSGDVQVSGIHLRPQMQTVDKRHVLRMLEKSLARELDLEKKLSELTQNEEDLRLKLHLTEQVALCMEEAAEVTWGRFLEAENTVEVLTGVSKEMVGRLQSVHFYLNSSFTREQELKSRLDECLKQLNAKEIAITKLNSRMAELAAENAKVSSLRENVASLEKKLKVSESQLKDVNECYESSLEQLREMDAVIESLKENMHASESKAQDAEAKIAQLTETNMELAEELTFLRGNNDRNAEKVSLLEKQLRQAELQLQHAKASSEASQEQQNMLYSAIWDMETLIDELKTKVSKAEVKVENTEEQCKSLTGTNLELNKELDFMKGRVDFLETSLNQATVEKIACAKDINIKTDMIMDMIMQLAIERERVQKQISLLTHENKILKRKLVRAHNNASEKFLDNGNAQEREVPAFRSDPRDAAAAEVIEETAPECSSKCSKVEESPSTASAGQTDMLATISRDEEQDANHQKGTVRHSRMNIFVAVLTLLFPVLAIFLFHKRQAILNHFSS